MTSNVIDANNEKHTIQPYRFKILRQQGGGEFAMAEPEIPPEPISQEEGEKVLEEAIEQTPLPEIVEPEPPQKEPQQSFIEEVLKKQDELSDNIIKLQMKIESQESEFKERLVSETAKAKEEGLKEGEAAAKAAFEAQINEIQDKFNASIKKLDENRAKLESFLASTEVELSHTAIDIAKEVVLKEIDTHSAHVAHAIATSLVAELKEASQIEIKLNPADLEYCLAKMEKKPHIKLSGDEAIAKGGALVLSNLSNMDGTLKTRFEKIKKLLES